MATVHCWRRGRSPAVPSGYRRASATFHRRATIAPARLTKSTQASPTRDTPQPHPPDAATGALGSLATAPTPELAAAAASPAAVLVPPSPPPPPPPPPAP